MTTLLDSTSRLRFAPSPTGTLHVGGARTALFNWLLARGCGGAFILRFEDTDRERSTEASVREILDGLRWLGLDWDEEPCFQSRRGERYDAAVGELLKSGHAYPCFCSKARLDSLRDQARKEGRAFVYDGNCRDLAPEDAHKRIEAGEEHVIRFRVAPGSITAFDDLIGGERSFENDRLGDFVIRRSDGSPIYHLTVVVDDREMGITHVVRGDDHLSNTPRQLLIFEALGWKPPAYAHLPLIQGPDRARLSKRHGATSLMEFADEGFLPEAMFNFLALLGWSLDAETEIMSREELTQNFSLDRVNRSAAIFDRAKLEWMNGVYLRRRSLNEVAALARRYFLDHGVREEKMPEPWFRSIVELEIERSRTLKQMMENLDYFFLDRIDRYDEKGAKKHFLNQDGDALLGELEKALSEIEPFDRETLEAHLRSMAESRQFGFGKLVHPLRLALTGRTASPGIFDVLVCLGRDRAVARIRDARSWIEAHREAAASSGGDA